LYEDRKAICAIDALIEINGSDIADLTELWHALPKASGAEQADVLRS
jgi:hypothetical protein